MQSRKNVRLCAPRGPWAAVALRMNRTMHGLVRRRSRGEAVRSASCALHAPASMYT